ncbi:anti-sigma factor family protein [Acidipila rosea]|uniref:Putative zinc finger protein n=1 Tax=Acidipila rosea TaxID=768535 RepID=A0A4R1L0T6_9BACT|nr:zf-HC2 domain-containing protein [Acidipila rosea]TCK71522.1 putative zinc finger protein [Acidipila rosea]
MKDRNPFERTPQAEPVGLPCEEWEAMLADALDGTLPATDSVAFESHGRNCVACGEILKHAREGREWLAFLHEEPEVPSDLQARILARTTGLGRPVAMGIPAPMHPAPVMHLGAFANQRAYLNARLLMTAAMAFFSIGITLNLAGVKLTQLRLADLRPSSMQANLSRQFYGTKGQIVRYYDNLRVIYEVEARVRELRRDSEATPQSEPAPKQEKANPDGRARKNGSRMHTPEGALAGPPVLARKDQETKPSWWSASAAALAICKIGAIKGGLL